MHACSLVSLVLTGNAKVNAKCTTNEVVQFFVCCATFVLSVGLHFSTRSFFFFSGHVIFNVLLEISVFKLSLRKLKFEATSSGVRVGIRMGVWVSRCAGVWVCW